METHGNTPPVHSWGIPLGATSTRFCLSCPTLFPQDLEVLQEALGGSSLSLIQATMEPA